MNSSRGWKRAIHAGRVPSSSSFAADGSLNGLFPAKAICKFTSNPSYCISVLQKSSGNVYESGRFSMRRSLSKATTFLNLIEKHLQNSSTLPKSVTGGLKDCQYLAQLNINFLSNSFRAVNGTDKKLTYSKADYIQSLLSAILTNIDTCLDGLNTVASGSSLEKDLLAPLIDCTKSYSLSLDLFTKGWVPRNRNRTRDHPVTKHLRFRKGPLPLRMSKHDRAVYNSVANRRRLSSSSDDGILVNGIVVVSQDGTGNFLTITEAVNAAPNNSLALRLSMFEGSVSKNWKNYIYKSQRKKLVRETSDDKTREEIRDLQRSHRSSDKDDLKLQANSYPCASLSNGEGPVGGQAIRKERNLVQSSVLYMEAERFGSIAGAATPVAGLYTSIRPERAASSSDL
ncbi:putative pectinesterase/pectinesterase inhibitor 41 [Cucurbita argyrosperma subsp. argyrosperma]|nr:putative pectinesterase/pectinesterase inhibitor 41 [Cucurbita argyrosperma subsp. argyrosperma]